MSDLRFQMRRMFGGFVLVLAAAFLAARVLIGAHDASAGALVLHADENCAACFAAGGAPDPAVAAVQDLSPALVFVALDFQSSEARVTIARVLAPLSRGPPSAFIAAA